MKKFVVRIPVELAIEIDADSKGSAARVFETCFAASLPTDPLAGTKFTVNGVVAEIKTCTMEDGALWQAEEV